VRADGYDDMRKPSFSRDISSLDKRDHFCGFVTDQTSMPPLQNQHQIFAIEAHIREVLCAKVTMR